MKGVGQKENINNKKKIQEDPLSIECLKGVKTLRTFNVMNCV